MSYKQTPEHIAKRSTKGIKRSAETRAKMSKAKLGKKLSPEHCKAVSDAKKGKPLSEAHRKVVGSKKDVKKSDAHRKAMSEAHLKRYANLDQNEKKAMAEKREHKLQRRIRKRKEILEIALMLDGETRITCEGMVMSRSFTYQLKKICNVEITDLDVVLKRIVAVAAMKYLK